MSYVASLGAPLWLRLAQVALRDSTARNLRRLGPIAFAFMAAILFLTYRTAHGVWLPLLTVTVSLLWTIAIAGIFGRSFSIVSSILPPLVLAIGTSYTMLVLSECNRQRANGAHRTAAIVDTLAQVGVTVLLRRPSSSSTACWVGSAFR